VNAWIAPRFSFFEVGGPSSSALSDGAISSMGCMVPQPSASEGNRSDLEFWVVIGSPWYLGYRTLVVAPEASVERVAGASHSMVG
jgi:hypothetical protein